MKIFNFKKNGSSTKAGSCTYSASAHFFDRQENESIFVIALIKYHADGSVNFILSYLGQDGKILFRLADEAGSVDYAKSIMLSDVLGYMRDDGGNLELV